MKVVGLVGKAGAGKDAVSEVLGKRYPSIRMGEIIVEEAKRRGVELTDENLGSIATELRERYGMGVIARRCIPRIRQLDSPIVVVNGIRGMKEVEVFRKEFEKVVLIEVWAPDELRLKRIRSRSRSDDVATLAELRRRDTRENRWGLEEAIRSAEYRIDNDGSLEELKARTQAVFREIERDP